MTSPPSTTVRSVPPPADAATPVARRGLDHEPFLPLEAAAGEVEERRVVVRERPGRRNDELGEDHDERADEPEPGRPPLRHSSARHPPVAPLYVPPNRASGVRSRIRRSTRGERCSTYHTSSSIRSAHGSVARPWICAQPVSPGRTSSLRRCRSRVALDLVAERRARPDHRHVAAHDVPELWELVDRRPAQQASDARDPSVAPVDGVPGARTLRVDHHRAQLEELEVLAVLADPRLPEEDRPPVLELHGQPRRDEKRARDDEAEPGEGDVGGAVHRVTAGSQAAGTPCRR